MTLSRIDHTTTRLWEIFAFTTGNLCYGKSLLWEIIAVGISAKTERNN